MNNIPIIMLSGFLGAGKTTLLNHLLKQDAIRNKRLALVINEFGTLGVDGALVEDKSHPQYEINAGSLFCSCTTAELVNTLKDLAENVRPELVLIEATGLATPTDLLTLLDVPNLAAQFAEPVVLTLVDAKNFPLAAANMQAARDQVHAADAIIVNKADLVGPEEITKLQAALKTLNPDAEQVITQNGVISGEWVLGIPKRACITTPPAAAPPAGVVSVTVAAAQPFDQGKFLGAVESLRKNLLRLKGNIDFGRGSVFVEWIGEELIIHDDRPAAKLPGLPTRFAAIAFGMPKGELQNALLAAKA